MVINKRKQSYWVKSGSISLITRMSMMFFSYLNFFLMARLFDKHHFGTWVIFLSILKISESIRTAFIYNPLLKFLNSEEIKYHEAIKSASFLLNLLTSFAFAVLILISGVIIEGLSINTELISMLYISIISVCFFSFFAHFNFIQQSNFKFFGTLVSSSFQNAFLSIFLLIVFITSSNITLIEATWIYAFGYIISAFIAFAFADGKKSIPKLRLAAKNWMKKLFDFGKYTFGTNLSSMINKSSKEWFLSGLLGNVAVALFAPALRVVNLFEVPLNALNSIYYPKVIAEVKEKGVIAARDMYEKTVSIIFLAMVPVVVITFVFAKSIISILVGTSYLDSAPLLRIIVAVGLLAPFLRQFGVTLNAIGAAKTNFHFMLISSIGGLGLSLIGIWFFGLYGAAYSTIATATLSFIFSQIILKRKLGVSTLRIIKHGYLIIEKRSKLFLAKSCYIP